MAKIANLLDSSAYSGAEKIALELIENDMENDVWYISKDGPIKDVLIQRKVKFFLYTNFAELKKFFKEQNFDIIHCHDYKASIKSVFLKGKYRVSHIHNNSVSSKKINIKTILYLFASLRISNIIYVSNVTKEEFIFKKYINNKSYVIPNWINKTERAWNEDLEKEIDILYVGRLSEEKNPKEVIYLGQKLKSMKKDIKIYMFGNGNEEDDIRKEINRLGLEKNIFLNSFTDKPHYYMKKAKILFVPSRWEGFGLVILEAMLNKAIVFANSVGGIKDIIHNGENGFFYKKGESEELILKVLNNFESYSYINLNAIKSLDLYNIERNTKKIYEMYRDIMRK